MEPTVRKNVLWNAIMVGKVRLLYSPDRLHFRVLVTSSRKVKYKTTVVPEIHFSETTGMTTVILFTHHGNSNKDLSSRVGEGN